MLGHRVVFTPKTLADARRTGWDVALAEFRASALDRVPPPSVVFESDDEERT